MLVLPHARRKRTAADAAGRAMEHGAVGGVAAGIVPALDAAGKAAALADAGDVNQFAGLKAFHQHTVADFGFVLRFLDADFLQDFHRSHVGFLEVAGKGLVDALWLDEFHEAELRGVIAVLFLGAALHDNAGTRLKNGAAYEAAVFGEDLRHAELDSDNSVDWHSFSLFKQLVSPRRTLAARFSHPLTFARGGSSMLDPYKPTGLKAGHYKTLRPLSGRHFAAWPKALISTSTPGGRSSFISASTVSGVGSRISIRRLCVRISNCSRDFLSTCGERSTVQRLMVVGRGIGPATSAPVRFAVSTISRVDWSRMR